MSNGVFRSGKDILAILDVAEAALDGEFVVYNGPIGEDGYGQFTRALKDIPKDKKVILILVTYGGLADSAYRIARYAQNFLKEFVVVVPSMCKSAGTLIALGAATIYMSPFGELGPLDVQVFKADEIFERRSGLLSKSAIWSLTEGAFSMFEQVLLGIRNRSGGTVGFKTSSQVAATITSGLISPIMSQLDPLVIGEDYQNLHIAQEYGERLVEKYGTVRSDAVSILVEGYPSHEFVIDYEEAGKLLGNVELCSVELMRLMACLAPRVTRPNSRDTVVFRLRDEVGDDDDSEAQDPGTAPVEGGGNPPESGNESIHGSDQQSNSGERRPADVGDAEDGKAARRPETDSEAISIGQPAAGTIDPE